MACCKSLKDTNNGFTIIEVVLVLAIAGLIFLMVFIALPALQRSVRDRSRKDAVSRTSAMIQNYKSNNGRGLDLSANFDSYFFTKDSEGDWGSSGIDSAKIKDYLNGQSYPAEIERISIFTRGSAPIFVKHPRRSVYDDYVGRLQIILRASCDFSRAYGEGFYPKFSNRTSIVAIHLENGDFYCEEF